MYESFALSYNIYSTSHHNFNLGTHVEIFEKSLILKNHGLFSDYSFTVLVTVKRSSCYVKLPKYSWKTDVIVGC